MSKNGLPKTVYRKALGVMADMLGPKRAKELDARFRFKRRLDLDNPSTLAEKISWIELNTDQTLAARLTDKYEVRGYIEKKGLSHILIPLVGGPWGDVADIDDEALPEQFVLKATHGCEMNYICKDKSFLNTAEMLHLAKDWLACDYPRACVEPHYKLIPHRVYAEQYVGGMDGVIDYKFHCINGEPSFILTCSERERALKLNLYDLEWNALEGLRGPMKNIKDVARPNTLSEMIEIARILASDFDFVRVDLYEKDEKVYFGELTFSPAAGVLPYFSDEFITYWGNALHVKGLDQMN